MNKEDYLRQNREPIPQWLKDYKQGATLSTNEFFSSRVIFYPGSGFDGEPVRVFGSAHSAHSFVYADYIVTEDQLIEKLLDPEYGFRGYGVLDICKLKHTDIMSGGWKQHVSVDEAQESMRRAQDFSPFGFLCILERDLDLDDAHGAERLAILFLGADAFAAYDALFCQPQSGRKAAYAVVVQDHSFGGNYDRFDRNGLLEQIAKRSKCFPDWLYITRNSRPWAGYEPLFGTEGEIKRDHPQSRSLWRCSDQDKLQVHG